MKVPEYFLLCNVGEGKLTLQIPSGWYESENGVTVHKSAEEHPDVVDYPDEWFQYLKPEGSGYVPEKNRNFAYLFLTRKGYTAVKDILRDSFEYAFKRGIDRTGGEGWPAFEREVEKFFNVIS